MWKENSKCLKQLGIVVPHEIPIQNKCNWKGRKIIYQTFNFLLFMTIVEEYMVTHMWFLGFLQLPRDLCK